MKPLLAFSLFWALWIPSHFVNNQGYKRRYKIHTQKKWLTSYLGIPYPVKLTHKVKHHKCHAKERWCQKCSMSVLSNMVATGYLCSLSPWNVASVMEEAKLLTILHFNSLKFKIKKSHGANGYHIGQCWSRRMNNIRNAISRKRKARDKRLLGNC